MQDPALHAHRVPVIPYEPRSLKGEVLAPRGSIVVYLAAKGSKALHEIHSLARHSAHGTAPKTTTAAKDDKAAHHVSLSFHDKILAEKVPVPSTGEVVHLILPYAGAHFDTADLLLHAPDGVEAIAVRHDPALTTIERAALSLLPRDLLSATIGAAISGAALNNEEERRRQADEQRQAQAEARAERAQQQAEAQADRAADRAERHQGNSGYLDIHMLETTIKSITAIQTATALIEIRRELLLNQLKQNG